MCILWGTDITQNDALVSDIKVLNDAVLLDIDETVLLDNIFNVLAHKIYNYGIQ